MSRRLALAIIAIGLAAAPSAPAQLAFTSSTLPSRTALGRVGLEKNWYTVAPLGDVTERVLRISLAEGDLFVQTNRGLVHAYDAESGRLKWTHRLGYATAAANPVSVNSDRVFVTNSKELHCLDRATGTEVWQVRLDDHPSSPTAADEETVVVGLSNGKVSAYSIRDHSKDKPKAGYSAATNLFNWKTNGKVTGRPIPADKVVAFASQDGRVYSARIDPPTLLFRFLAGGPVVASMGTLDTRTLLAPSMDYNLYALDLFTARTKWIYAAGAPIDQQPLVAGDDIFVINQRGVLASVNAATGQAHWRLDPGPGQLVSVGRDRVYVVTPDHELEIVDRHSGRLLFTAQATFERAGLNLRDYTLFLTNRFTDRLYMATPSGLILCLREAGEPDPMLLRDPKRLPFGYLPPEDAATPAAAPVEPPAAEAPAPEPTPQPQPEPEAAPEPAPAPGEPRRPQGGFDAP
jgi:outer membrane protein assembly factor BamB